VGRAPELRGGWVCPVLVGRYVWVRSPGREQGMDFYPVWGIVCDFELRFFVCFIVRFAWGGRNRCGGVVSGGEFAGC
jgi:hypothetical protein